MTHKEKFKPGTIWKVVNDSVHGPEYYYAFITRQHLDCFSYYFLDHQYERAIGYFAADNTWIRVS